MSLPVGLFKVKTEHLYTRLWCRFSDGLSVVTLKRMIWRFCTALRNRSCCSLVIRWISSQNTIDTVPYFLESWAAFDIISANPFVVVFVLLISYFVLLAADAMILAIVVFPIPEPPQRIMFGISSFSTARRNIPFTPVRCYWPTISLNKRRRMRSASGLASILACPDKVLEDEASRNSWHLKSMWLFIWDKGALLWHIGP